MSALLHIDDDKPCGPLVSYAWVEKNGTNHRAKPGQCVCCACGAGVDVTDNERLLIEADDSKHDEYMRREHELIASRDHWHAKETETWKALEASRAELAEIKARVERAEAESRVCDCDFCERHSPSMYGQTLQDERDEARALAESRGKEAAAMREALKGTDCAVFPYTDKGNAASLAVQEALKLDAGKGFVSREVLEAKLMEVADRAYDLGADLDSNRSGIAAIVDGVMP